MITKTKAIELVEEVGIANFNLDEEWYGEIIALIKAEPSAEKVGHWDVDNKCSVCETYSLEGVDGETWDYWEPNYCPHCGAKNCSYEEWQFKNCCCFN